MSVLLLTNGVCFLILVRLFSRAKSRTKVYPQLGRKERRTHPFARYTNQSHEPIFAASDFSRGGFMSVIGVLIAVVLVIVIVKLI
jgi:hypothetical protein